MISDHIFVIICDVLGQGQNPGLVLQGLHPASMAPPGTIAPTQVGRDASNKHVRYLCVFIVIINDCLSWLTTQYTLSKHIGSISLDLHHAFS